MNFDFVLSNEMSFSTLFKDYLNEKESILSFFDKNPFRLDEYLSEKRTKTFSKNELVALIREFNKDIPLHKHSLANLESLSQPDTFTVTTGQQIGLFGGYLYTVYKTITVIKLAKELSQKTGKKVVPIFWIADEDHDFEEANHLFVPQVENPLKIEIERVSGINQQVGRELVPENITEQIDAFFQSSGETEFSQILKEWLSSDFKAGTSLRNSFLGLLNRIFGKQGLVFFGSDSASIKKAALPILLQAIDQPNAIFDVLEQTSVKLEKNYSRQAQTDSSLLFLNCKNGRIKLHFDSNKQEWNADGKTFSSSELKEKVISNPELVSPNVFLRPMIQEFILPNLAYVAGPGEVAYYAQMQSLFHLFDLDMPAIVPRLSVTLIDKPLQRYWNELPLKLPDFYARIEDVEKKIVSIQQPFDVERFFEDWSSEVKTSSNTYIPQISEIDASLEQSVERAIANYINELDKIKGKVNKSIKQKDDVLIQRVRKAHLSVYPNQTLQERVIGFAHYLNKYGTGLFDNFFEDSVPAISKNHLIVFI